MQQSISKSVVLLVVLVTCLVTCEVRSDEEQEPIRRVYSDDVDESSCVCGLSKTVLDKLESIVQQANSQQCSLSGHKVDQEGASGSHTPTPPRDEPASQSQQASSQNKPPNQFGLSVGANISSPGFGGSWSLGGGSGSGSGSVGLTGSGEGDSLASKLNGQIQALQDQLANSRPNGFNSNQQQEEDKPSNSISSSAGANLNPFAQLAGTVGGSGSAGVNGGGSLGLQGNGGFQTGGSVNGAFSSWGLSSGAQPAGNNGVGSQQESRPNNGQHQLQQQFQGSTGSSAFLQGLPASSTESIQNQNHKVEPQEVQETVVSTVPNVVSNIFTNIQDFAIQTEHNPNSAAGSSQAENQLTSIDGSSAHLNKNDTAAQITAQGEQLFLLWIEHQIQTYHMTASMAAYIRKSALNLFRRIVKQYVQRIERLGGAVESNVRQATQLALNNTQNLISFLLRNYLNVAAGLMQIIGEQVSRVGKQMDSTGETIAHINLNPFDIVSNVIDSLPNPSHYSEYFRAFGKYLMGEQSQQQNDDSNNNNQQEQQTGGPQQTTNPDRHKGLFSKTMGALGKTLGSWIG